MVWKIGLQISRLSIPCGNPGAITNLGYCVFVSVSYHKNNILRIMYKKKNENKKIPPLLIKIP